MTDDYELTAVEQIANVLDKNRKVDLLIAHSPDWSEGDKEDLMASADKIVNTQLKNTPGALSDVDLDEYGTGVGN